MLDINYIRMNPGVVKKAVIDKLMKADIDKLLELDVEIKDAITLVDSLRAERNNLSKQTQVLTGNEKDAAMERGRVIKERLLALEGNLSIKQKQFDDIMLTVPSIPAPEVPFGRDESANVEIRRWGAIPNFDFPPKDHMELAETLDLVDVPRAVKFAGSRAYFLKNEGALLDIQLALDVKPEHMAGIQEGYTGCISFKK